MNMGMDFGFEISYSSVKNILTGERSATMNFYEYLEVIDR